MDRAIKSIFFIVNLIFLNSTLSEGYPESKIVQPSAGLHPSRIIRN